MLKAHPRLYWHPLVARQILHLLRLVSESGRDSPQGGTAVTWLKALAEAHANGLHLGSVIGWKPEPKKSGPEAKIENPYPAEPGYEFIKSATLSANYDPLHGLIKAELQQARGWFKGTKTEAEQWYRDFLLRVLKKSDIEWSALRYLLDKSSASLPTASEVGEGLEGTPVPVSVLTGEAELYFSEEDFKEPWGAVEAQTVLRAALGPSIVNLLKRKMGRAGKDGRGAYLTYTLLGSLLGETPAKIRDAINNYRRKKKASKPKPTS